MDISQKFYRTFFLPTPIALITFFFFFPNNIFEEKKAFKPFAFTFRFFFYAMLSSSSFFPNNDWFWNQLNHPSSLFLLRFFLLFLLKWEESNTCLFLLLKNVKKKWWLLVVVEGVCWAHGIHLFGKQFRLQKRSWKWLKRMLQQSLRSAYLFNQFNFFPLIYFVSLLYQSSSDVTFSNGCPFLS